jgi:hypothetical protein
MGRSELERGQQETTAEQTSPTVEPTPGKVTNTSGTDPQQDDPRRELDVRPDFSFAIARTFQVAQIGAIKAKGTVKLDAPNASVVAKDETSKLQMATRTVGREFDTNKGKTSDFIALALAETSTYLGQPASWLTVDFKTKFGELKLNLDELKLASIGFRGKGTITRDTHPMFAWLPNGYVLSIEVELTYDIAPKDLATLAEQMKQAVDLADQVGDESDKLRDAKIFAEKLADDRKKAQGVIESLKGKRTLTTLEQGNLRKAQSKIATLELPIKQATSRITAIQKRLGPLKVALEKVHVSWLRSLAKLQPFLKKFEAEIAEQLAKRVLLRFASKLATKAHPILAIITTVVDLLYICKFLIDLLYLKNLKFVGFGGDYEPELLDWEKTSDGDKKDDGDGGGAGTTRQSGDGTVTDKPPIEAKKKLYDLKGPQARVVSLLLSEGGLEQSLEPTHFEALYRILTTYPIESSDIGELIAALTPGQGPDKALRALEAFLASRDRERKAAETGGEGGGGGGGDVDTDGGDGGGGDRKTEERGETRGEVPGSDERSSGGRTGGGTERSTSVVSYNGELGESLSTFKGTERITVVANLKGWITYVDNSNFTGRTVRLVVRGTFKEVKGGWQFTPKTPGIRMIYVRVRETVNGKRVEVRKPVFSINIQPQFFPKKR